MSARNSADFGYGGTFCDFFHQAHNAEEKPKRRLLLCFVRSKSRIDVREGWQEKCDTQNRVNEIADSFELQLFGVILLMRDGKSLLQACFQPFEQTQLIEIENSEKEEEDWPIKLQNPIRVYDIST